MVCIFACFASQPLDELEESLENEGNDDDRREERPNSSGHERALSLTVVASGEAAREAQDCESEQLAAVGESFETFLSESTISWVAVQKIEHESCIFCHEAFEPLDRLITLQCMHFFHYDCAVVWFRKSETVTCPVCNV